MIRADTGAHSSGKRASHPSLDNRKIANCFMLYQSSIYRETLRPTYPYSAPKCKKKQNMVEI